MSYRDLYGFCQRLPLYISRNQVRDEVKRLKGIENLAVMKTAIDVSIVRGFYLSARNTNHRWVQQHGAHVIVLPKAGLNHCWERFVFVKELMHCFDDPLQATDSGDTFDMVLSELMVPQDKEWSPQMLSEIGCFWMALGCLCPEESRVQFASERAKGQITDYDIALKLRIPQQYVPFLFAADFHDRIESVTK